MLENSLLLSSSQLNAGMHDIWRYSVINMSNHEDSHTVGFIMNQLVINFKASSISKLYGVKAILPDTTPIYCGGPVSTDKMTIIHSNDYKNKNTTEINDISNITFDDKIFQDIENKQGPKQWKIMLGYCAWLPGQLDAEINRGQSWMVAETDQLIWGKYKKKLKMWTRLVEKNSSAQANQFLESLSS